MNEEVQIGSPADGHGILLWCTTIADPSAPTAAELAAGIRITYGITPDGVNHTETVQTITTGRWTLDQALEIESRIDDTLELTYVYGRGNTETDVQTTLGTKGTKGFFVKSLGYPNDHEFAAGDVINRIIPGTIGTSRDVPPAANTELAKIVKVNVSGKVQRDVVVAGAAGA